MQDNSFWKTKYGAGLSDTQYQNAAFNDMYVARSSDLRISSHTGVLCTRRRCLNKTDCGFIPNYPLLTINHTSCKIHQTDGSIFQYRKPITRFPIQALILNQRPHQVLNSIICYKYLYLYNRCFFQEPDFVFSLIISSTNSVIPFFIQHCISPRIQFSNLYTIIVSY